MKFQDIIKKTNKKYIKWLSKNYIKTMLVFSVLTLFLGYFSLRIPLDARMYNLFPTDLESIKNNQKLEQYYGGEGYLIASLGFKHPYRDLLRKIENMTKSHKDVNKAISDLYNIYNKNETYRETYIIEYNETLNIKYVNMVKEYKGSLDLLKDSNEKSQQYTKIFIKELEEIIIPETTLYYKNYEKEPSINTLSAFDNALAENMRAFDLYTQKVVDLLPDNTKESLIQTANNFTKRVSNRKDLILYTDYFFSEKFVEDHLLYFLDIKDLEYINQEIKNKTDYERRKNIIAKSLLIDGEKNIYSLDFQELKDKYFSSKGTSYKLIRVLNGEDAIKKSLKEETQFYINTNKDTLVVLIKASKGSPDITFGKKLIDYLDSVVLQMKKDNLLSAVDINFYGRYKDRSADVETLNKDFKMLSPIALIAIFIIIFIHFRSWHAIIIVCLPLLSDIVWALGITYFTIGKLNLISSFIIAIMSGLGVNFGTHLYNRYIEERLSDKSVLESLTIVFQNTFVSNVTATTTTSTGFFTLGLSQFQGFSEFGIIAGIGMLCLLAGIFLVFPATIFFLERYTGIPIKRKTNQKRQIALRNKPMPYYKLFIIAAIVMTVISLVGMKYVTFNANFTSLINQNRFFVSSQEGLIQAEDIIGFYNLVPMPIYAPNYETMKEVTLYILNKKKRYIQNYRIESLYNYVPDDQKEKQVWLKKINKQLNQEIMNSVEDQTSKDSINRLKELTLARPTTLERTPTLVKNLFKGKKEGYFILFYPTASISKITNVKGFTKELMEINDRFKNKGVFVASDTIIFNDIYDIILNEAPRTFFLVVGFFLILLWLDFRSWKQVFISLIPLGIGIFWILGFYYLLGFEFNYFNIVMFPVIIAIGLDDGVHLLHRYHEEGGENLRYIFANTGRSIFIAGIQDIIGFSAFLLAFYVGLNTIGQFLTIGVISCMFVSTLVLPSVLQLFHSIKVLGFKKAVFSLDGIKN